MNYWTAPKLWDGDECFIIGGGSSLLRQFDVPEELIHQVYYKKADPSVYSPYLEPLHNKKIIAVNMACKLGNWVDVLFFGDQGLWTRFHADLYAFKGLRVSCANKLERRAHCVKLLLRNPAKRTGITFEPNKVSWNQNSGAAAINLAVHFGVKRIVLLGFDMKLDEKTNQHWHKYYSGHPKTVKHTFNTHLRGFPVIAEDLKGKVEVVNTSMESAINCFPKVNIKDIL
jgi:hypothetical protein